MSEETTEQRPLTPEGRARFADIQGQPLRLADGKTWLLACSGLRGSMRSCRDDLFDEWIYSSAIDPWQARAAAYRLLRMNYDLAAEEAIALLVGADLHELANAVIRAAIPLKVDRHTFTDWAEGALWANGIDPTQVPSRVLPHVLAHLVATGLAIPVEDYTDAGQGALKRATLRMQAIQAAES